MLYQYGYDLSVEHRNCSNKYVQCQIPGRSFDWSGFSNRFVTLPEIAIEYQNHVNYVFLLIIYIRMYLLISELDLIVDLRFLDSCQCLGLSQRVKQSYCKICIKISTFLQFCFYALSWKRKSIECDKDYKFKLKKTCVHKTMKLNNKLSSLFYGKFWGFEDFLYLSVLRYYDWCTLFRLKVNLLNIGINMSRIKM